MKCYLCPKEGKNKFFDYPLCDSCIAMAKGHIEMCLDGVRREKEGNVDINALDEAINALPKDMSIWTAPGEKVRFTDRNGRDSEREQAEKKLEIGKEYTVSHCVVGGWSSDVFLEEVPGCGFNTVMFENVGELKEVEDKNLYSTYRL